MKLKFNWIDVLIIVLFLLSVYFILTRIFGNSASDLTIMISLISLLGGLFVRLIFFTAHFYRGFGEFKIKSVNSFNNIKGDMDEIKGDLSLIKAKLKIKG